VPAQIDRAGIVKRRHATRAPARAALQLGAQSLHPGNDACFILRMQELVQRLQGPVSEDLQDDGELHSLRCHRLFDAGMKKTGTLAPDSLNMWWWCDRDTA
jgi:hypothetical protein